MVKSFSTQSPENLTILAEALYGYVVEVRNYMPNPGLTDDEIDEMQDDIARALVMRARIIRE